MNHKKVLFDDIFSPTKAQVEIKKAYRKNRIKFILFSCLRWSLIILIAGFGTLFLSAVIIAIFQEQSITTVFVELLEKTTKYL